MYTVTFASPHYANDGCLCGGNGHRSTKAARKCLRRVDRHLEQHVGAHQHIIIRLNGTPVTF